MISTSAIPTCTANDHIARLIGTREKQTSLVAAIRGRGSRRQPLMIVGAAEQPLAQIVLPSTLSETDDVRLQPHPAMTTA